MLDVAQEYYAFSCPIEKRKIKIRRTVSILPMGGNLAQRINKGQTQQADGRDQRNGDKFGPKRGKIIAQ